MTVSSDPVATKEPRRYRLSHTGELFPLGFKPASSPRIDADVESNPLPTWDGQPGLAKAFMKHDEAVFCRDGSGLIPMDVKEPVRLRVARVGGCKICSNTRNAVARDQGVSEEMLDQVTDHYEESGLTDYQKVALRYTDAILLSTPPSDELKRELLQHFTVEQIVELTLFVSQCRVFAAVTIVEGIQPDEMPEKWVH
jgi:alkylhydroperoxidase family enzyme